MPESIRPEKNILAFNQGLNTESSEIAFPDGFTTDERNYELLLDGSRRRRKGLAQESGGSTKVVNYSGAGQTYVWKNVGGNPDKTFIVHKFAQELYFSDDASTVSTTFHSDIINLDDYPLTGSTPSPSSNTSHFTSGRGYLVVTSKAHFPLIIEYRSATDDFLVEIINPVIRDFQDQIDGVAIGQAPTTITAALRYNLINRGWTETDIAAYYAGSALYPNKSVPWHKGIIRTIVTGIADEDGTKSFSHVKYTGEPISASSAPKGSMFVKPLDSRNGITASATVVDITNMVLTTDHGSTWTVTITTGSAHGLGVGVDVQLQDTASLILDAYGNTVWIWDGDYTTQAGTTGSTIVLTFNEPSAYVSMDNINYRLGTAVTGTVLERSDGSTSVNGFRVCAFHDGRLFMGGLDQPEWADYVFFSQIPEVKTNFAKCYQEADPTDPENNQLVDTDGGWFAIQGIQGVKKMLSVRSSLLVFAENGVWEISGGQRGFFTPSGYSVRKVTDVGCNSPMSPIAVENNALYTGAEGVYVIAPNQYTGILEATSISNDLIQTKWNDIPDAEQALVMSAYDSAKKRVYFLYGKNADTGAWSTSNELFYNKILILNTDIPAWSYYSYNTAQYTGIVSMFPISTTDGTDQANKMKFSCMNGTGANIDICDHDQTDYIDYDGAESPLPYAVTGWDNLGDFQRRRQAPIITVYSKRTETGYTDGGAGWSGDNESSTKMTAFWDWTEAKQYTSTARTAQEDWDGTGDDTKPSISGKIDNQQQVYRHTRAFTPANATDVDGYPVVVTRNKVRGRGRVLQLRFDGEATKDSHIMGFTVNYRAQRAV